MTQTCPKCGREVALEGASFCPACGAPLSGKAPHGLGRKSKRAREPQHKGRGDNLARRIQAQEREAERHVESRKDARRHARTVQGAIGFDEVYADGICRVEDCLFSQTILVPDVNFMAARPDEQNRIWNLLCSLYNSFSPDVTVQLTILNRVSDASGRYDQIKLPYTRNASEDHLVDDYNAMLREQVAKVGRSEIVRDRYLTLSVPAASHEDALVALSTVTNSAIEQLRQIGAHARALTGDEYLALVGSMLRPDDGPTPTLEELGAGGVDQKDAVSPSALDFTPDGASGSNDCWRAGASPARAADGTVSSDMWYQSIQFREPFPSTVDPAFLGTLVRLPIPMALTIHIHPIDQAKAIGSIQKKISFMKSQESHEGKAAARQGLDPVSGLSLTLTQNLSEGSQTLDALLHGDERLFTVTIMVTTWARDRGVVRENAFRIAQEASKRVFSLSVPRFQNRDSMNTMLPLGNDYMAWHRKLLTTELATFLPFVTQEISDRGGVFYGNNQLSGNMIILNRKRLAAPMGWIMGKPGSGKSFAAKQEIFDTAIAHPDDDIFIIDPKGEYAYMTEVLGGQTIDLSAGSPAHLNPFDISSSYSPDGSDPVIFKSSFVTSLISSVIGERAMTPKTLSIIDRAVTRSYAWARAKNAREHRTGGDEVMPTLTVFWTLLSQIDDPDARDLASALEIYVSGSLRTFAYPSNVDINARIVDFNMKRLQGNLRLFGQLVATDAVWNRTTRNHEEGKRTWIYIDEAQNFFDSQAALDYFTKYWAEGRSYGLIPTGITQNADRIIHHDEAKHMFSNSEFVELLSQAPRDLIDIQALFNLSDEQVSHVKNSAPGQGLLIAGGAVIPFRNEFPKNSRLYEIMDTDPNAAEEKRRAARHRGWA